MRFEQGWYASERIAQRARRTRTADPEICRRVPDLVGAVVAGGLSLVARSEVSATVAPADV